MSRGVSFLIGVLTVLTAVALAVLVPMQSTALFEKGLMQTVNREAVGMSESDLTAFARETMDYLCARKQTWEPQTPFAIPGSFVLHMAQVRAGVSACWWAVALAVCSVLIVLLFGRIDRSWHCAGMSAAAGMIALVLLWAAVDFNSLWYLIHRLLIPGGIFSASEPVMQLFSLQLFFGYIGPVMGMLAAMGALIALFSVALYRRARTTR